MFFRKLLFGLVQQNHTTKLEGNGAQVIFLSFASFHNDVS